MAAGDLLVPGPVTRIVLVNNTSTAYTAGQFVLIDTQICRCLNAIAAGASGAADILGVFEVLKVAGAAWVLGDRIYWVVATSSFTSVAGANVLVGHAYVAATAGALVGYVNINAGPS